MQNASAFKGIVVALIMLFLGLSPFVAEQGEFSSQLIEKIRSSFKMGKHPVAQGRVAP